MFKTDIGCIYMSQQEIITPNTSASFARYKHTRLRNKAPADPFQEWGTMLVKFVIYNTTYLPTPINYPSLGLLLIDNIPALRQRLDLGLISITTVMART